MFTVGQLKKVLCGLPDEMPVFTEGCDCEGEASGAVVCMAWSDDYQKVEGLVITRRGSCLLAPENANTRA